MEEDLLKSTANGLTVMGLPYFGGHAIANDGNIVGLGNHCPNTILGPIFEIGRRRTIRVSKRPPSSGVGYHGRHVDKLESGELLNGSTEACILYERSYWKVTGR